MKKFLETMSLFQVCWCLAIMVHLPQVVGHQQAGELYTSLHYVKELLQFDKLVASAATMINYPSPETISYLKLHSEMLRDATTKPAGMFHVRVAGNPLHIYSLFKRLVLYWPAVEEQFYGVMNYSDFHPIRQKITDALKVKAAMVLPEERDLRGAGNGLVRLQRFYRLPLHKLTMGQFYNIQCSVRLTVLDCLSFGKMCISEGHLAGAWEWYKEAKRLSKNKEQELYIQQLLNDLKELHDSTWVDNNVKFFPSLLSKNLNQRPWDQVYYKLCRGMSLLAEETKSRLKCFISSRGSPYLLLQPVKVEQLHYSPNVSLIYNVISDKEIEEIQRFAKEKLTRSTIIGDIGKSEVRVSQTAWLSENDYSIVQKLSRRISAITGLNTHESQDSSHFAGEPLQVLSYGIGGHYQDHYDWIIKFKPEKQWFSEKSVNETRHSGDRLATWMFYLSDVAIGGRTAFSTAKISAPPVKGAAVFWYNLRKNGEGDSLTKHGGCPVLLGWKWVANKWIREHQNMLTYPCDLDKST